VLNATVGDFLSGARWNHGVPPHMQANEITAHRNPAKSGMEAQVFTLSFGA
jgi:hypothetical protein